MEEVIDMIFIFRRANSLKENYTEIQRALLCLKVNGGGQGIGGRHHTSS